MKIDVWVKFLSFATYLSDIAISAILFLIMIAQIISKILNVSKHRLVIPHLSTNCEAYIIMGTFDSVM